MKRISILFSLLFFLPACGLLQSRSSKTTNKGVRDVPFKARTNSTGLRKRVLVLPFLDEKLGRSKTVSDVARKTLVRELLNTRHFVVVKNSDFPQDLFTIFNR